MLKTGILNIGNREDITSCPDFCPGWASRHHINQTCRTGSQEPQKQASAGTQAEARHVESVGSRRSKAETTYTRDRREKRRYSYSARSSCQGGLCGIVKSDFRKRYENRSPHDPLSRSRFHPLSTLLDLPLEPMRAHTNDARRELLHLVAIGTRSKLE